MIVKMARVATSPRFLESELSPACLESSPSFSGQDSSPSPAGYESESRCLWACGSSPNPTPKGAEIFQL